MVSSPVSDLPMPKASTEIISEYTSSDGETYRVKVFMKNGVKMISMNDLTLEYNIFISMLNDVDLEADDDNDDLEDLEDVGQDANVVQDEDIEFDETMTFVNVLIITVVSFIFIILYMYTVFEMTGL